MSNNKSSMIRGLQLHKMPPTCHITMSPEQVKFYGSPTIRREASLINRKYSIFLQCHMNEDRSMTIWHNPKKPEKVQTLTFENLLALQAKMREYQTLKNQSNEPNAYMEEMLALQGKIDECVCELKNDANAAKRHQSPGAIRQPLAIVLDHLGVTEEVWKLLPLKLQLKYRIKAEVQIRAKLNSIATGEMRIEVPTQ